ncbi:hypothetical protein [Nonomuraea sp. NPDC003709]|uniref:hypothetical protein n=1 Tax=Nonomuraea sp. NPDC003709 TaxID=3154450 RepID=UPI0033B6C71A
MATLLGLSLGVILRNGAVATAALVTIVLVLPPTWAAFTVLAGWAVVPLLAAGRRE